MMSKMTYGSKADHLQKLDVAGFNIPKFYIIPAKEKDSLLKRDTIKRLQDVYNRWTSDNGITATAIRSSSTQEDTADRSYAGQFSTVLDVHGQNEFIEALKTVFSSKQSSSYSAKSGSIHAIAQEFIEPDAAGVIFSINPTNGNSEIVINAAYGRGTNVADGEQVVQYFVSRINPSVYKVKNDEGIKEKVITDAQIKTLCDLTIEIESLFAYPQDIEWAIKDGTVYILQARPITKISHLRLWDSSNISESFPGIVLPLTFSIAKRGYLLGYKAQAQASGLRWYDLEAHHRVFDSMVGIFNGRIYYNMLSWYNYISLFPGNKKNQRFLDDQIATQGQAIYQPAKNFSVSYNIRYSARLLYRVLFFKLELNRFYRRFADFEYKLGRLPAAGDAQLLMHRYGHIEQTIIPHFGRTLDNDFLVMTYHGWLKRLLSKWIPDKLFERNNIIGSMDGVMSARQALSLYTIASKILKDKRARELLQQSNYPKLQKYLEGNPIDNDLKEYIEIFGHRFAEDQKIESVNPVLEQYGIYKLMKVYIQLNIDEVVKRLNNAIANSREIERGIEKQLRFNRRIVYRLLLRKLKKHLRLREKNRLLRGRVYSHMRELFPKIGQAFADERIINRKDDIFYLEIEEIYQLIQGSQIFNDFKNRIDRRRDAYSQFGKIDMPERFMTTALPSMEKIQIDTTPNKAEKIQAQLSGLVSSPGTVVGKVLVLNAPKIPSKPYDILVASHTDPGWTPLIALAKGVIVEHGGMLSHAAIVTRELGIPSIIGVSGATTVLKTGMRVRINTQTSSVDIIK